MRFLPDPSPRNVASKDTNFAGDVSVHSEDGVSEGGGRVEIPGMVVTAASPTEGPYVSLEVEVSGRKIGMDVPGSLWRRLARFDDGSWTGLGVRLLEAACGATSAMSRPDQVSWQVEIMKVVVAQKHLFADPLGVLVNSGEILSPEALETLGVVEAHSAWVSLGESGRKNLEVKFFRFESGRISACGFTQGSNASPLPVYELDSIFSVADLRDGFAPLVRVQEGYASQLAADQEFLGWLRKHLGAAAVDHFEFTMKITS